MHTYEEEHIKRFASGNILEDYIVSIIGYISFINMTRLIRIWIFKVRLPLLIFAYLVWFVHVLNIVVDKIIVYSVYMQHGIMNWFMKGVKNVYCTIMNISNIIITDKCHQTIFYNAYAQKRLLQIKQEIFREFDIFHLLCQQNLV